MTSGTKMSDDAREIILRLAKRFTICYVARLTGYHPATVRKIYREGS